MTIKTSVGDFDVTTKTVPVTFTVGDVVHERTVNACLTDAGEYDKDATIIRVDEVGNGVKAKVELGVIVNKVEPELDNTESLSDSVAVSESTTKQNKRGK